MKYKEFIAKAAIEIMAHQCESFNENMFTTMKEDGTIIGPSIEVEDAAMHAVIAAKALAKELEEDFAYENKDGNHKMNKFEDFFDKYEVD